MKIPQPERKRVGKATEVARGVVEGSGVEFSARELLRPEIDGLITRLKKEGVFDFLTSDMPLSVRTTLLYFPEKRQEFQRFEALVMKHQKMLTNVRMVDGFVQAYPERRASMREVSSSILEDVEKPDIPAPRMLDDVYTAAVLFPERLSELKEKVRPLGEQILGYIAGEQNSLGKLQKIWMGVELILLCPEYRSEIQKLFHPVVEQLPEPKSINASVFLNVVYFLEIIYGTDIAELNEKGEVEFKANKMESKVPLPERPTI